MIDENQLPSANIIKFESNIKKTIPLQQQAKMAIVDKLALISA